MKTIQTKPDCTLGFLSYPEGGTDGLLILHDGILMKREMIGKLSEVTEEQARELVEQVYGATLGSKPLPMYKNYLLGTKLTDSATYSLQSAALSVGIEEKDFDKYLVVKL